MKGEMNGQSGFLDISWALSSMKVIGLSPSGGLDSLKADGILSLGVTHHVQRLSCRGRTSPLDRPHHFLGTGPEHGPSPVGTRLPRWPP